MDADAEFVSDLRKGQSGVAGFPKRLSANRSQRTDNLAGQSGEGLCGACTGYGFEVTELGYAVFELYRQPDKSFHWALLEPVATVYLDLAHSPQVNRYTFGYFNPRLELSPDGKAALTWGRAHRVPRRGALDAHRTHHHAQARPRRGT
ncbi:hypothetical protein AB0J52_02285 [Spirillospora sp. NPDC049652]